MSGVLGMYEQEIIRHAGELGGRFRVQVVSGNNKAGQVLQTVLEKLGCMQGDRLTIHISQSGQRASFESARPNGGI